MKSKIKCYLSKVKKFALKSLSWLKKGVKLIGIPLLLLLILIPKNCTVANASQVESSSSYYYTFSPFIANTPFGSSSYNVTVSNIGFFNEDDDIVFYCCGVQGHQNEYYPIAVDNYTYTYNLTRLYYTYISSGGIVYRNAFTTDVVGTATITLLKDPYVVNGSLDPWFEDYMIYDDISLTYETGSLTIIIEDGGGDPIMSIVISNLPFNSVSTTSLTLNSFHTYAFNAGYVDGKAEGLEEGYERGKEDTLSSMSPLTPILGGVESFLKTPFFGNFCILDVLKIVGVAFLFILFIKFFVGG